MRILFMILLLGIMSCTKAIANEYASSNQLKTLFTTPYQRHQLDQQRNSGMYANGSSSLLDKIKAPRVIQMQGVLIRGNKVPVAFINDQSTLSTHTLEDNITVQPHKTSTSNYSVPLRANSQQLRLKPGQQWSESNKKVLDNFQTNKPSQKTDGLVPSISSSLKSITQ